MGAGVIYSCVPNDHKLNSLEYLFILSPLPLARSPRWESSALGLTRLQQDIGQPGALSEAWGPSSKATWLMADFSSLSCRTQVCFSGHQLRAALSF